MMRGFWKPALVALAACSGCTTVSLTEYTISQNRTAGECRDKAVLDCLASVAANPENLPSYALYSNGITTLQDTVTPGYTATWMPGKATAHALAATASRSPKGLWTVDPSADFERIEAFHAACLWALYGPEVAWERHPEILGDAQQFLNQKPHFGVATRLAKLAPGWVHTGRITDVPVDACYKSHCGKTWIWVMPGDAEAFAQFVLAFQDIATLDVNIIYSPPLVVQLTTYEVTRLPDATDPKKAVTISTVEPRAVKTAYRDYINKAIQSSLDSGKPVALTRAQWLECTEPWTGLRMASVLTPAPSMPSRTPSGLQLAPQAASNNATRMIRPAPEVKFDLPPQ
jgi:hypothetical protein